MSKIDTTCIICSELIVCPRFYENCGHTICEGCMVKNDEMDIENNRYVFEAVEYRCPLCRTITLKPWFKRPFNHALASILEKDVKYSELEKKRLLQRKIDLNDCDVVSDEELRTMNMSKISYTYRDNLAEDLYNYILPAVYDGVMGGKPYIVIKDRIKELRSVSDLVSNKLIKNNNIYRVFSTNNEFTIEIIPTRNSIKYDYVNDNFNQNLEISDDEVDINLRDEDDEINEELIPLTQVVLHTNIDLTSMQV
jgi:hypothetical protein